MGDKSRVGHRSLVNPQRSPASMRNNAWTTTEELAFLNGKIPGFLRQQEVRVIAPFLAGVASEFLAKFPSRATQFSREDLTGVRKPISSRPLTLSPHPIHPETAYLVW